METLDISNSNAVLFHGDNCNYYSYKGKYYTIQFPLEWVIDEKEKTGLSGCNGCYYHGRLNGVFIGYCTDCAIDIYNYQRGHGFIHGVEEVDESKMETSATHRYLKYVKMETLGDKKRFNINTFVKTASFSSSDSLESLSLHKPSIELLEQRTHSTDSLKSSLSIDSNENTIF